jgi:secondary thiamine-phosphate synthase enzyme
MPPAPLFWQSAWLREGGFGVFSLADDSAYTRAMESIALVTEDVPTQRRCQMIDITATVQAAAERLKIADGMVIIHAPHTTAAVTINENADPDVQHDLLAKLEQLMPHHESFYEHSEGNSDSHVKSSLVGCSQTVLIERGKLALGTWQGIYFCEFDGPRRRQCWLKFVRFA